MPKPVKLRIKEKMTEKEQAIEKFTDILNFFHDNRSTIEDFKYKFSAWSKAFISENKLNESLKSQAIVYLKLSRISRVLITAIVSVCILETYTKFQKSFAYLGLTLYLSVIAMNLVSTIIIAYRNSQNEYISEVNQYFVSVYAMFQVFKLRLDVLRRRCNWDVKSDSVSSGDEPDYSNQDTDYGRLYSSAFHLYNIYGTVIGFIIFLLCFYLEFEIFASLEVFTICLIFAIAIAKDIKFHKLHGRLQKSTKFMRNVTIQFLTWFENDCEICKILQQHQVSNTVTNLFLTRTLNICRKPRYLNFAISITTCKVFTGLNVSRNDFKNALMFIAYGKYFVLDKLTVKTINTQVVKQPCKEKTAKEKYKLSFSNALARNLDHSREIAECTGINKCRVADDNTKQTYSENKTNVHFANEDSEIDSKHINKKGTSTPPKYTGKASKVSLSNNKTDEALNPETKGRSFDESLPLRYELRKIEPEEEAESTSETHFSDIDEMNTESICKCKLHTEHNRGKPYNGVLCCKQCLNTINRTEVLSPISAKELRQIKINYDDGSEKSCSNFEEIFKKSICNGTFDAEDIGEKSFNVSLLCKRCFDIVNHNSTHYAMSENELCRTKEEPGESVTKHLTKVSEEYCNTDDLFISEYKDTDLKMNGHKLNKSAADNFNKSVVITSTAETANFNELVRSDFNEINDSNLHEQRTNEIKFKDESETVHKDVSLNLNGNKPDKINVKCFMTDNACLSEHASDHTSDETKNYIHENEMLERQFNEGISSDKQERITQNNSTDKTNKSFLLDLSHQFKGLHINLSEKSETHSNSDRPFESSFTGNSESDSNKQNKNSFDGEYNEIQIPCDEINYERRMNNIAYDTENYPSGSNSFENEISDSGFFEPGGNETKSNIEYRIIEEDKIEDKHNYAPAEVTDNVRVTSNTIEETEVHSNQNETSEKIFNENRKSYLHEQELSETKLMDMNAHDITTKKCVVGNISNNPNPNTDKDILNHDVCISENDSMFVKNGFETNIDNSSYYPIDSGVTDVNQNIKSRTAISSINKSNYEGVINSLSNETKTSLNVHKTSDDITNTNKRVIFDRKPAYETQLSNEFGITPKTVMELGINLTGEIDTFSNFKDICENQNVKDTQEREKNNDENIDGIINEDMSNEFLSKVNVKDIRQRKLCYENMSSVNGGDLTLLKPCETARDGRSVNLQDVNKGHFTPENAEEDRNGKIDKERKAICQRKNSKNRKNRKRSQKKKHFKSRNKETINRFANEITDSAGAIDHQGDSMEAFPNESTDLEEKELMPNDSKNFSLLDETDKTAIGIAGEISEQIKHVNITKTFEEVQNFSLQKDIHELVTDLNNHDKINTASEIHQNSLIINQEYKNKLNDSMTDSAGVIYHLGDTVKAFPNESTDLERKELIPNESKNFSLLNGTDKTEIGIDDETSEQMKDVNVTKTFEEVQNSSLQKYFSELLIDLNNHDKINTASEIHQNSLILNQEDGDKLNDSLTTADCYFDAQKIAHEANYPELNFSLSQETDSPVSDKELAWTMIEPENFKQAIGSEHKSNIMERPYCETNNKIEVINTNNIKSIFATPSFAIEPLKNDDKCIVSTNETVHNKNELTNIPKSGDIILHSTNTPALSESENIASAENIATDNSRSKSCLTDTSSRIIKKGKRRFREKFKNEEQTNFVSLEMSPGRGFNAKTSTEEENSNRLIIDKVQTNCVSLVSPAGSVLNAKTSTEEENSNRLIVDKKQIICSKEQANCISLESSAGSGFNAKISTEKENGNRLIVDKEPANSVSLESSAEGIFNAKANTEEENRSRLIVDKEHANSASLELSAGSVLNAKSSTEEENSNRLIVDKTQIIRNKEQANCVSLESTAENGFNAKTSTEKGNGNSLIVDKEQANSVSLESSEGGTFNAKTSTEEENSNRLIIDKVQTNCVSLVSPAGSVLNAKTSTEEENSNRLIVDKKQIICSKEQANCVSLESSAGSGFNAKISTEKENGNRLIVDKEPANSVSLESSAEGIFNAKANTEEENRSRLIVDKEHANSASLELSAGSVLNAKSSTEEENSNRLIVDKTQIIRNKEQTNCVSLESTAENGFNAKTSTEKGNGNSLIVDKEQANSVSLESSEGGIFNAKTSTEEENSNSLTVDKTQVICNKKQNNCVSLESSAESVSNPKVNTKKENNVSTVIVNIHSLNERKIQLAEQLPLESGDTESKISFSENSSCQKLTEDNHRIRSLRNINDEVQNRNNESSTNTAKISNLHRNHRTRYPGNINYEVENKITESTTNTVGTSNSFKYNENKMTDKCTTNPEISHNQFDTQEQSFPTVASNIENDVKISKVNEIIRTRNTLTRLWKNEKNKMFNLEYRNAVKRKIIHLEKELRTNGQSCSRELSVVDIKENKFAFQTADGDEHFSSELEVTCKYPDDECEEIQEKRIRSWLQSVTTENSSEISQKGLNESETPPTGSSEDSNYHFHPSTSPSDTSWDASGESGDSTYSKHRSSACFSPNQESFECLEINKDKNTSLEKRVNRIGDSSDAEISKNHGGIKWVTMSSGGKPYTTPNRQPIISSSTSNELEQPTRNSKSNEITRENRNKTSEIDNESKLIFQKSGKFSYSADACSTKKHLDSTPSNVQLNSKTFEALACNYDAEQNYSPKTNQTDPLKYHLIYKNIELHVLDSSSSITIRLVDENDDNDAALTPRWKRFVNSSLSSSNSSIHELQLPSEMSSSSSGETVKENINISEGELKMLVGKSDHAEVSVSSDSYKNLINKNSVENIAEVTVIKDSDILINSGNADKVNQNKENQSAASEFHESESFVNKHALNESIINNNDVPGGYNETVMKETVVVRTCSFENTDVRDNDKLIESKSADKVSEEKNKEVQSVMHEFRESERITNKNIINESFVVNNDVPDGNIENLVKETEVIAICSAENIDVSDNGNLIDIENSDKVIQHKNKGDQSAMFEFDESKHFVDKHPISESVEIGDYVLGRNTETVLKETKVQASVSFDKDCDEVSDIRDNDNLIDSENADKVSQQKNKEDRVATYEFHEPEKFANKHRTHTSSLDNTDVPAVNIETAVKETGVIANCSSGNISFEQYSVENEISKANANNVTDKNKNEPVINDSYVPGGSTGTVVKETGVVSSCSFQKNHNNSAGEYLVGNEISETDANNVSDTNVNPAGISENVSVDTETIVTTENKFSKDFQFETNGIKLTCKPGSESDSVEVKFRKLEDKTKLTFKSGYKKLYLKMSSKT